MRNLRSVEFEVPSSSHFSPQAYSKNPKFWENKLTPWITRELQAILEEEDVHLLVSFLLGILQKHDIHEKEAKEQLNDILYEHTDTFVHEFYNFSNSSYDIDTWDRYVQYDYSHATPSLIKQKQKTEITEQPILIDDKKNLEESEYTKTKKRIDRTDADILKLKNELHQVKTQLAEKRQKLEIMLSQ